jgi:hypothetical protein
MARKDPRVDAYILKAKPFARPVLKQLRAAVRAACPAVEETIKWGMPSFEYKGPMCGMAAFKEYVTFGFWKHSLLADRLPSKESNAMSYYGKIRSLDDVPSRASLIKTIRAAMELNDKGIKVERKRTTKPPVKTPAYFMAALRKNAKALATFEAFPPSHKREYVEWVDEAKREDTRARRLETAIEWIANGKSRNWKYA